MGNTHHGPISHRKEKKAKNNQLTIKPKEKAYITARARTTIRCVLVGNDKVPRQPIATTLIKQINPSLDLHPDSSLHFTLERCGHMYRNPQIIDLKLTHHLILLEIVLPEPRSDMIYRVPGVCFILFD